MPPPPSSKIIHRRGTHPSAHASRLEDGHPSESKAMRDLSLNSAPLFIAGGLPSHNLEWNAASIFNWLAANFAWLEHSEKFPTEWSTYVALASMWVNKQIYSLAPNWQSQALIGLAFFIAIALVAFTVWWICGFLWRCRRKVALALRWAAMGAALTSIIISISDRELNAHLPPGISLAVTCIGLIGAGALCVAACGRAAWALACATFWAGIVLYLTH